VNVDVAEAVKLELALASIRAKKFSMAEYFLEFIQDSKNPRIKAGVVTCLQVHPDGSPVRNESQTSFATEELRGVVRIEFPPDI
jgi:peptidyl-tRNA hydrolase